MGDKSSRANRDFQKQVSLLSTAERITRAKEIIYSLTERVINVVELASVCDRFVYSEKLSKQIPVSYAGHAFRVTQDALFRQLIVQTVALWDRPDFNVVSILTATELIEDDSVIHALQDETYCSHANRGFANLNPVNDPDIAAAIHRFHVERQKDFAASQAERTERELAICLETVRETISDLAFRSIENLRDHFSHSLTKTRREERMPIPLMKYGEERDLRLRSIRIIESLYSWVNGVGFDIGGDCLEQAERNASELWDSCRFNVRRAISIRKKQA